MIRSLLFLLTLLLSPAFAQTVIEFWHSQDSTVETIEALAAAFNQSQSDYQVLPRYAGSYDEAAFKLIAAYSAGNQPVLFDAELTVFPRLVEEGTVLNLDDLTAALPADFIADFYPALWNYGDLGGRYGLPWNMSVTMLFYNATAFKQRGIATPPLNWAEFEAAAKHLTTRQTKGYIGVNIAFIFEMMVSTRGGQIVTDNGKPNFDSPEAIEALTMLQRLAKERAMIVRSFAELDVALLDFVRTKGMMSFASFAFLPQGQRYAIAFELGVAPVPAGVSGAAPLMGAQLVVIKGASEAQRQGAFAFWQFLTRAENIKTWVEASYFLPVRRAALPLLEPWYNEDPARRISLEQLEQAVPRPRIGSYAVWQSYLQEALDKALKAGVDPATALAEAQRRALEDR